MKQFYLIQRGKFQKEGIGLTGRDGVIDLDYMGAAEFEFGAIPRSFRRMMYHYGDYDFFNTGIFNTQYDELIIFCKKEKADEIIEAICAFIEKPWYLKEWSGLEDIKTKTTKTNFWWCIDNKDSGDWMAFFAPKKDVFKKAMEYDYENWWMRKSPEEREGEYRISIRGW